MMKQYRKKPIVVEAVQWFPGVEADGLTTALIENKLTGNLALAIVIETLEGTVQVSPGDWIIRGVNGEYYPCKPDIFEKTYEEVSNQTP